jgi:hypothetical protein
LIVVPLPYAWIHLAGDAKGTALIRLLLDCYLEINKFLWICEYNSCMFESCASYKQYLNNVYRAW